MKIALLSFGSLVNTKGLNVGPWKANGPVLPIELTRIAKDGRLTPVIDEKYGNANTVFFAISKATKLNTVIVNLLKKEKVNPNFLGIFDIKDKAHNECIERYSPRLKNNIYNWAVQNKVDVVVFNALGRKFKNKIGVTYSQKAAMQYLSGLKGKNKTNAINYIKKLPKQLKTNFRTLFETEIKK